MLYSILNPFPIQFLALLAYLILRVIVGVTLLYFGAKHLTGRKEILALNSFTWWPFGSYAIILFGVVELLIGAMFFFGAYTQIAALVCMFLSVKMLFTYRSALAPYFPSRAYYFLLFGCALSLFITGAGAIAVDLPI